MLNQSETKSKRDHYSLNSIQYGSRQIGPPTVGPWTVGPRGPIVHFFKADSLGTRYTKYWTFTDNICKEMNRSLFLWPLRAAGRLSSTKNVASTYNIVSTALFLPTFGLRVSGSFCRWPLGKPQPKKNHVYLGIAQIAIWPPLLRKSGHFVAHFFCRK